MNHKYDRPLISIVTVCYNSASTIETTIKSILSQTYDNYEYIIIDGQSKDKTLDVIKQYKPMFKGKLRVYSEPDTGIYNAMNKGIRKCKGDIIGIINSDDYYSNNTLKYVAQKYAKEKYELLIINGDMVRVSGNGQAIYRYHFTEDNIKKKQCFGHPSMFAAKAVYDRIGLYDESYKLAADGDWQYRALEDPKVRYVLCPKVFNHMREGGASDNHKYRWKWFAERSRMKKNHHKGSDITIYYQEMKSVLKTDIKTIMPNRYSAIMYRLNYNKSGLLNSICKAIKRPKKCIRVLFSMIYNILIFQMKKVKMKSVPRFDGVISLNKHKDSIMQIGKGVFFNSGRKCNPVGFENKMMLTVTSGAKLLIGDNVGMSNSVIYASNSVIIEDCVMLGNGVKIYDTDFHSLNAKNRKINSGDSDTISKPVYIKKGAFIGAGTTILKGVTIGEESVIGACSVVTKNVPNGEIWAGNPARLIRRIKNEGYCNESSSNKC